jgi:hypothetical protein
MIRDEEPTNGGDDHRQEPTHVRAVGFTHRVISNGIERNVQC